MFEGINSFLKDWKKLGKLYYYSRVNYESYTVCFSSIVYVIKAVSLLILIFFIINLSIIYLLY